MNARSLYRAAIDVDGERIQLLEHSLPASNPSRVSTLPNSRNGAAGCVAGVAAGTIDSWRDGDGELCRRRYGIAMGNLIALVRRGFLEDGFVTVISRLGIRRRGERLDAQPARALSSVVVDHARTRYDGPVFAGNRPHDRGRLAPSRRMYDDPIDLDFEQPAFRLAALCVEPRFDVTFFRLP
jgi:hypothetical protein